MIPVAFKKPVATLWRYRGMLRRTTWNEIRTRHAGSMLGLLWLLVYPLLFLGVYSMYVSLAVGFREGADGLAERVLLIFCGLIPFFGFAEALSGGTVSVTENANLIKNTLFPIELIPVKAVFTAQCTQVVGTGLLLIALAAFGKLTLWALCFPVIWALQIVLTIGLIWILSSLNVYFRDLKNVIGVAVLMLMLVSPIAWKGSDIPPQFMPLMYCNPLYYLIVSYQECLLYGRVPDWRLMSVVAAAAFAFFFGGYWFFSRMKQVFADNV